MTLMGMTGYGRADGSENWGRWSWEVRSVNGKSLDIRIHGPSGLEVIDQRVREAIKSQLARGNVQVQFQLSKVDDAAGIRIDTALLGRLARRGRLMARSGAASAPMFDGLLGHKGVLLSNNGQSSQIILDDEQTAAILKTFAVALAELVTARKREGDGLEPVMFGQLDHLRGLVKSAELEAASQAGVIRERFETRLSDILGGASDVPEDRIVQEAAIMAGKADVREELDRLLAHIDTADGLLKTAEAKGRKLDFLCQELNREANTLCSKSAVLGLTNIGLELKATIEQFREQVQNVE